MFALQVFGPVEEQNSKKCNFSDSLTEMWIRLIFLLSRTQWKHSNSIFHHHCLPAKRLLDRPAPCGRLLEGSVPINSPLAPALMRSQALTSSTSKVINCFVHSVLIRTNLQGITRNNGNIINTSTSLNTDKSTHNNSCTCVHLKNNTTTKTTPTLMVQVRLSGGLFNVRSNPMKHI